MFAVAISAIRCVLDPGFDGLAVYALEKCFGDFFVACSASLRHIPVTHPRARVTRGQNSVNAVAVGAGSRILTGEDGATVNALQVLFDWTKDRNLVPRQKPGIGMTFGTCRRLISFCHCRCSIARRLNIVHRSMAGDAGGSLGIAGLRGAPVNAFRQLFHFFRVTLGAFRGLRFGRRAYFVNIAVARGASRFAKRCMNTLRRLRGLIGVARRALDFRNFCGMRKILDGRVTVLAAENTVHARGVLLRADGNIHALFRFHARLPVASEAGFILFQRLSRFFLLAGKGGEAEARKKNQQTSGNGGPCGPIRPLHGASQHVPAPYMECQSCFRGEEILVPISRRGPLESWDSALPRPANCGRPRNHSRSPGRPR